MAINEDYLIDCSIEDIGLDADILYKALLGDQCFCITDICPPPIDLSGSAWELPVDLEGDMFKAVGRVSVEQLTNPEKTGAFDVIAASIKDLIQGEHERGRITGPEYSKAYTSLLDSALTNATQFLLQKDIAHWQAQKGLFEAWQTRAEVELVKHNIALAQMQQLNQQVEFANGKMQMMVLKENYCTAIANRDVTIPKQAEMSDTQIDLYKQQIVSYQRDAEVKAARVFTDAWITMKTIDEGLTAPNGFTNERVDDVLAKLRDENGFVITP